MSAGVPIGRGTLLVLGGLALAAAVGIPIASWAALLAMLCFVFGACAYVVGAEEAGRTLLKAWLGFLFVALSAGAIGGGIRAALATPSVQGALCLLLGVLVLAGAAYLGLKAWALAPAKAKLPKFPVRARAAILDPVGPSARRGASASPAAGSPPAGLHSPGGMKPTDDDLGIFGRKRVRP